MQKILLSENGKISQFLIVFTTLTLGLFLCGGLISVIKDPPIVPDEIPPTFGVCCDKGDGDACVPYEDNDHTFTYNDAKYGLLKSNTSFVEGVFHLKDSGEKYQDHPIIINTADGYDQIVHKNIPQCLGGDAYAGKNPSPNDPGCFVIPNDAIVYVCKEGCYATPPSFPSYGICNEPRQKSWGLTCYGDNKSRYDVYFKISEFQKTGIPDPIKNCSKEVVDHGPIAPNGQYLLQPNEKDRVNLHINTFTIVTVKPPQGAIPWFSPWCKPAIYLYPPTTTSVNVKVQPQGKMTLTIPEYPENGWNVTAHPDGLIENFSLLTNNYSLYTNRYDYLYYEAEIPDTSYTIPQEGYVISQSEMNNLFLTLLPQLGLNQKETQQFSQYWVPVLPKSPYYFVGIIPQENLDTIAPLSISPKPDTVIRVSLYFKALDEKIEVPTPHIKPVTRTGFTTVEWGGIFKRDGKHNFSCFM